MTRDEWMKKDFAQQVYDGILAELDRLLMNYRLLEAQGELMRERHEEMIEHRDEWREYCVGLVGVGPRPPARLDWEEEE